VQPNRTILFFFGLFFLAAFCLSIGCSKQAEVYVPPETPVDVSEFPQDSQDFIRKIQKQAKAASGK